MNSCRNSALGRGKLQERNLSILKSRFGSWQVLHFKKITYISSPSNLIRPRVRTHITFKIDVISLLNIWSVEREAETEDGLGNIYNQVISYFLHYRHRSSRTYCKIHFLCEKCINQVTLKQTETAPHLERLWRIIREISLGDHIFFDFV